MKPVKHLNYLAGYKRLLIDRSRAMFSVTVVLIALALTGLAVGRAAAHCDTMDGPVVKAAQSALDKGDANMVLAWIQKDDEQEIRAAFQHTLDVRKLGPEAKKLADTYFFETLIRVHRAGEGAPYTGLKPAGLDLGPALTAADKALETKQGDAVTALVETTVKDGINDRFKKVVTLSNYKPDDVEAGRKYVAAYVDYIHYVEGIYNAANKTDEEHGHTAKVAEQHNEKH